MEEYPELDTSIITPNSIQEKPILNMFSTSFTQGIKTAIKDNKSSDYFWVFDDSTETILSFNWYCEILNQDKHKIRKLVASKL